METGPGFGLGLGFGLGFQHAGSRILSNELQLGAGAAYTDALDNKIATVNDLIMSFTITLFMLLDKY
jgi:hypothetical protein